MMVSASALSGVKKKKLFFVGMNRGGKKLADFWGVRRERRDCVEHLDIRGSGK
jgi:hypothetical protein